MKQIVFTRTFLVITLSCGMLVFRPLNAASTSCTVSASGLNFGVVSLSSQTDITTTGTIEITCDKQNASYTVMLSSGAGTYTQRLMVSNGRNLSYNIYTSASYTSVWGDGTGATMTAGGAVSNKSSGQLYYGTNTLYGRIPFTGIQNAYSGSYSDTIMVTINY